MEKKHRREAIVPVFSMSFQSCDGTQARLPGATSSPADGTGARVYAGYCRSSGTRADTPSWFNMRNEEYTMGLLLAVGLIAVSLAGVAGLFEASSSQAVPTPPTEMARLEPVRVVGTPFVPNVRPSER